MTQPIAGRPGKLIGDALNDVEEPTTHERIDLSGPSYAEEIEIERRQDVLQGNWRGIIPKRSHPIVAAFGAVIAPIETWVKAHERGDARNEAILRDGYTRATLLLASDTAFPEGYVAHRGKQTELGAKVASDIRVAAPGTLGTARYEQLRATIDASAREGVETAIAGGLTTEDAIAERRRTDGSFDHRFAEDVAFREGVKSVVWLAKKAPIEVEARRVLLERGEGRAATFPRKVTP